MTTLIVMFSVFVLAAWTRKFCGWYRDVLDFLGAEKDKENLA